MSTISPTLTVLNNRNNPTGDAGVAVAFIVIIAYSKIQLYRILFSARDARAYPALTPDLAIRALLAFPKVDNYEFSFFFSPIVKKLKQQYITFFLLRCQFFHWK